MAKIIFFQIKFSITSDDKEHQDAVVVQVINGNNQILFNKEIVPSTGNNGNDDDQNAYYWPSDGPGKHPHFFNLPLSSPIGENQLNGSRLVVTSSNGDGGNGDFESWIADVSLIGYLDSGDTQQMKLNGGGSANMNWQNGDNGKSISANIG